MKITKSFIALMAVAAFTACSSDDAYDPSVVEQQYESSFNKNVLGDGTIDKNQTWNTSVTTKVTVTSEEAGTIRVYSVSPMATKSPYLISQTISANQTLDLTLARPMSSSTMYVALIAADGSIKSQSVTDNGSVKFTANKAMPTSARMHKVTKEGVEFRDMADELENWDFTIPSDAEYLSGGKSSGVFYVDNNSEYCQTWSGGGTVYVKETADFTSKVFYLGTSDLYLLPNVTLTLTAAQVQDFKGNIYIPASAKLVIEGSMTAGTAAIIYNKGTVTASGDFMLNTVGGVVNEGTIEIAGKMSSQNTTSELVNNGTFKANSYYVQGGSKFLNTGTMNIAEESILDCQNGTWINEGRYETGSFDYTAGTGTFYNNCLLYVNGLFANHTAQDGKSFFFVNGGIYCEDFYIDKGVVKLAENVVFRVNGTATMNIAQPYPNGGIAGPDNGGYAVFSAKNIVLDHTAESYEANYAGNLYVVADESHFDYVYYAGDGPNYATYGNAKVFTAGSVPEGVHIAASDCRPGFNEDPNVPVVEETKQWYYYAFEDLGASDDIDFNDVVVRVSAPENGVSTIQLLAAGGTKETYVLVNDVDVFSEVHAAFHLELSDMINTRTVDQAFVDASVKLSDGQDASNLDIKIKVAENGTSTIVEAPLTGAAPKMIRVIGRESDGKWFWPTERTNITTAYPKFADWAKDITSNTDWYENPVEGVVSY